MTWEYRLQAVHWGTHEMLHVCKIIEYGLEVAVRYCSYRYRYHTYTGTIDSDIRDYYVIDSYQ